MPAKNLIEPGIKFTNALHKETTSLLCRLLLIQEASYNVFEFVHQKSAICDINAIKSLCAHGVKYLFFRTG